MWQCGNVEAWQCETLAVRKCARKFGNVQEWTTVWKSGSPDFHTAGLQTYKIIQNYKTMQQLMFNYSIKLIPF